MSNQTPAGYYPDPAGSPARRWWDGAAWGDLEPQLPRYEEVAPYNAPSHEDTLPPPGYYEDPDTGRPRYWDGGAWANPEREEKERRSGFGSGFDPRLKRFAIILAIVLVLVIILSELTKSSPPATPPTTSTTIATATDSAFCTAFTKATSVTNTDVDTVYHTLATTKHALSLAITETSTEITDTNAAAAASPTSTLHSATETYLNLLKKGKSVVRQELAAINAHPQNFVSIQRTYNAKITALGTAASSTITPAVSAIGKECRGFFS